MNSSVALVQCRKVFHYTRWRYFFIPVRKIFGARCCLNGCRLNIADSHFTRYLSENAPGKITIKKGEDTKFCRDLKKCVTSKYLEVFRHTTQQQLCTVALIGSLPEITPLTRLTNYYNMKDERETEKQKEPC